MELREGREERGGKKRHNSDLAKVHLSLITDTGNVYVVVTVSVRLGGGAGFG